MGVGLLLPSSYLGKLFSDFTQLSEGSNKVHQGTGLGLALTKRLVEAQGGRVGVRSTLGVGSVFWAVLHRRHGTDTQRVHGTARDLPVLFVHENEEVQQAVANALAVAGIRMALAGSVREAVTMATTMDYSALALSLSLPDEKGLSVVKTIREDAASLTRHAPVLGLSMTTPPKGVASFAVADVIAKPIDAQEVVKVLRRLTGPLQSESRVLIVDDDPLAVQLMEATLNGLEMTCVGRTNPREALERLDDLAPDVIVLDLMMPSFDGFDVLDALSRMDRWRDTPVVIWTSMTLAEPDYQRLLASAEAIVQKGGGSLDGMLQAFTRWRERLGAEDGQV